MSQLLLPHIFQVSGLSTIPVQRVHETAPKTNRNPSFCYSASRLVVTAKKRLALDGLNDELNAISSINLDFAPSRRRVRSAFTDFHRQLDHFLFKIALDEIQMKEWFETNSKGIEVFCKSWMPKIGVEIIGALYFCHGYGDTCTFFFEGVAKRIAASGYVVFAMDYPGFGLSEGLHGYISSFDELIDNVAEQYIKIKGRDELRGIPHFIMGQSMGGAVALKMHIRDPLEWDGMILVAPMCKIADSVKPPPYLLRALSILSKLIPQAKLFPTKDTSHLSFRDPRKRIIAKYNVIAYSDRIRLRTAVELLKATAEIESEVEKVSCPVLILQGGADGVTDPAVSRFLYERASSVDKTMKMYQDGFHCLLEGEPDDRIGDVLSQILHWLHARSPSPPPTPLLSSSPISFP